MDIASGTIIAAFILENRVWLIAFYEGMKIVGI